MVVVLWIRPSVPHQEVSTRRYFQCFSLPLIYFNANNIFGRKNDGSFPEANQGAEYFFLQTSLGRPTHQLFLLSMMALFTFLLHIAGLIGFPSLHLVMFGKKSKRALCLSSSTLLFNERSERHLSLPSRSMGHLSQSDSAILTKWQQAPLESERATICGKRGWYIFFTIQVVLYRRETYHKYRLTLRMRPGARWSRRTTFYIILLVIRVVSATVEAR